MQRETGVSGGLDVQKNYVRRMTGRAGLVHKEIGYLCSEREVNFTRTKSTRDERETNHMWNEGAQRRGIQSEREGSSKA